MKSKIVIDVEIRKNPVFKEVVIESTETISFDQLVLACQHFMVLVTQKSPKEFDQTLDMLLQGVKAFKKKDTLH